MEEKLTKNVERDSIITTSLEADGWMVIRLWESDIRKNLEGCVETIINARNARKVSDLKKEHQFNDTP